MQPDEPALPGFTDVARIGTGRVGTVFRARELGSNRFVAVKVFDVAAMSSAQAAAYEREAAALRPLSAEADIVAMYGAFVTAEGCPALVLELCAGSLASRLEPGIALDAERAVSIGITIGTALEAVHGADIVYHHLTPENVLLTERGRPVLADLGEVILQRTGQFDARLFDFTSVHAAPESLEGEETSAATDVYGLASTLYQIVTGQPAFRAYDEESPASVSLRILRDPVPPIVSAQVPVELSDLLLWGMAKEPARRPPSAAIFTLYLTRLQSAQGWPSSGPAVATDDQ